MSFFNSFEVFFNKEDFDFDRPDIDLYKFHSQLRVFFLPLGIFFNNQNSLLRLAWPAFSILFTTTATALQLMCVIHSIQEKDYSVAAECFFYFMFLCIIPIVYCSTIYGKNYVLQILDSMNKDFLFICKLNLNYRNHFLQNQLLIWKLCFLWIWFNVITTGMFATMTLGPLLYQTLFATQDEYTVRPLIFPIWLPNNDAYRTPLYEVFMFIELFYLLIVLTFGVYVYIQFHVLLHNIIILDLIIMDFGVIFEGLDEGVVTLARRDPRRVAVQRTLNSRMKRIVNWHISVFQSIANLSSVQGPPLVYQMMLSSIPICMMAYQVAVNLENGKFDILFVLLLLDAIGQILIPCYLGTMLRNKAYAVGDACWDCGWHKTPLGLLVRNDISIVILRSQKPLSIKFTGLANLSLETFSSIARTAYSYFNMLRQYN